MHDETGTEQPWVAIAIAAVVFAIFIAIVAVIARGRKRRLIEQAGQPQKLEGFGGWLALLALGQTLAPLRLAAQFLQTLPTYKPVMAMNNGAAVFYGEAAVNTVLTLFVAYVTVRMWQRKRTFPVLFTWEWAVVMVVPVLDLLAVSAAFGMPLGELMDREFLVSEAKSVVALAWILYVHRSVRVRNTFVA